MVCGCLSQNQTITQGLLSQQPPGLCLACHILSARCYRAAELRYSLHLLQGPDLPRKQELILSSMSVANTIFICEGAECLLPKDSQEPLDGFPSFREMTCLPDYTEVAQRRSRDTDEHQLWTVFQGINNDPSFDPKTDKFGTPQQVREYDSPQQYGACDGHRFPLGHGGDPGRLTDPPNRPEWMHSYPEAVRNPKGKLCYWPAIVDKRGKGVCMRETE